MNTIQSIIRKKWLELLAVAQIAIFIFAVGTLQVVNSQIPPDASIMCSPACSGGGCSITVSSHEECVGQPDHACNFFSAHCSCNCGCGTTTYIEDGQGGMIANFNSVFNVGNACGISS